MYYTVRGKASLYIYWNDQRNQTRFGYCNKLALYQLSVTTSPEEYYVCAREQTPLVHGHVTQTRNWSYHVKQKKKKFCKDLLYIK